jgi:hypothetical protein
MNEQRFAAKNAMLPDDLLADVTAPLTSRSVSSFCAA